MFKHPIKTNAKLEGFRNEVLPSDQSEVSVIKVSFLLGAVCSTVWLSVEKRSAAVRSSHRSRTRAAGVSCARALLVRREELSVTVGHSSAHTAVETE